MDFNICVEIELPAMITASYDLPKIRVINLPCTMAIGTFKWCITYSHDLQRLLEDYDYENNDDIKLQESCFAEWELPICYAHCRLISHFNNKASRVLPLWRLLIGCHYLMQSIGLYCMGY